MKNEDDAFQVAEKKENRVLAVVATVCFCLSGCLSQISLKKSVEYEVSAAEFTFMMSVVRFILISLYMWYIQ
jgi:hypothetical protein